MSVQTAYDRADSEEYDELRFRSPAGRAIAEVEEGVFRTALDEASPEGPVLEVGCGTGRFTRLISRRDCGVFALDPSGAMLAQVLAARVDGDVPILVQGEAKCLPFPSGAFAFTYCIRVLNQTASRDYALQSVRELLRVTRAGGLALVEFANARRPRRPGHTDVRLDPAEVVRAGVDAGARLCWLRGGFALGMTAYHSSPAWALGVVGQMDRAMARRWAFYCARCYALFEAGPSAVNRA